MPGRCVSLMLWREGRAAGVHFRATTLSIAIRGIALPQGERGVRRSLCTETGKNKAEE